MNTKTKPEEERAGFMQRILPKTGKASRPDPSETDALGNKRPEEKPEKKSMTVWLEPAVIKQFKVIAAEQDMELQELMAESLNRTFAHYHKPQIA